MMTTREQVTAVAVPEKTATYSPVAHADIIDAVYEQVDKRGLEIRQPQFWSNNNGKQVTGKLNIFVPGDEEFGMATMFRNSYDRSMSLGFAAGGNVWICTNGEVSGDITLVRRHVGSIAQEVNDTINSSIDELEKEYQKLSNHNQQMKNIELSRSQMAELVGRIFFEEELVNVTQLSVIKNEFNNSEHFKDNNLWCTYNHVTEAYKKSSAYSYIDYHKQFHNFIVNQFDLKD